jgi:hypothetical protein
MIKTLEQDTLAKGLDKIIGQHGFWAVVWALVTRKFHRDDITLPTSDMSDYVRRDIGLPPNTPKAGQDWYIKR